MKHKTSSLLAIATVLGLSGGAFAADPELTVFDWAGWGIPGISAKYVEKYGDSPTYSFFGNDDEAFQKVSSGFKADLAHPCVGNLPRYRDAGLIEPWDVSKITEFSNIHPSLMSSSVVKDDQGVWFIPSDYAYTAIAYNTKKVKPEEVASLQVFVDPKFAGRVSLPDNADDVWALAFLATGVTDWSNVTDKQFTAAADWLRQVHPNVRAYWADPAEMSQLMATGEVLVAWSWNDGVAAVKSGGFPVGFNRTPKEGASNFYCGYVNIKDAPGSEEKVYDFMNSFLDNGSAKAIVEAIGYAISNDAALKTLSEDELKAAYLDPVEGTMLTQTPLPDKFRKRMLKEFENIKAGF